LRQEPREGTLPIVLFLTDGLPTIGQTSEKSIRELALKANPHEKRLFTFGVGVDVNTPLLDQLAATTRATASYVLPHEDVEVKVAQVFEKLAGPVLANPDLELTTADGRPAWGRVRDLIPAPLPDLFEGDQLVLIGQYTGDETLHFRLTGNYLGRTRSFRFNFSLDQASTRNAFVPRLWASRKIAVLIEAVRKLGADRPLGGPGGTLPVTGRARELVDEIISLSIEFGILTEYTSFFAKEGTDLGNLAQLRAEADNRFRDRAWHVRSGISSVNQEYNKDFMRKQRSSNIRNTHYNKKMEQVSVSNVQQINDRAFYRQGHNWVDSRLIARGGIVRPDRKIKMGSSEHGRLVTILARQGRAGVASLPGAVVQMDKEIILFQE